MNLSVMHKISKNTIKKPPAISKRTRDSQGIDTLHHLAFENSFQANIITTVSSGQIISANNTACKLLGYSKEELLTKTRASIFDIDENSFKMMMEQREADGRSTALVQAIKKNGRSFSSEITSAVFINEDGIENAIFTIADLSQSILKQKRIDVKQEKIVAGNIVLAKSKQKEINAKQAKKVAGNIILAKSKQKEIDAQNEKVVVDDIILAQAKSDARLVENNEWIKYIAKTSYDVMWDWNIASGEIYVGDSVEEVFGYTVQNNIVSFKNFCRCLLPEEKDTVEKKLLKILASPNKTWKDSFMFKRHDGSVAIANSRASIVRNETGKAIRLIGATQDVSRLQELETKLEEQVYIQEEHKLLLTAKLSFDVIWDWNLLTNEVYIGEEFEELFGYTIKNNKGKIGDKGNHLHADDREAFEKGLHEAIASSATHWEYAYRFTRADGTIANVFDRASIIRHAGGKAYRMIGTMQDLSRQKELEEKVNHQIYIKAKLLSEYRENFKLIFNSSFDAFYDCDVVTKEVIVSDAFEKEFGYKTTSNMTSEEDWVSHIHPDDKEEVIQDYLRTLASKEIDWTYSYRFLRADNSVAKVLSTAIILRNTEGKAYRMIGHMQDMSKQKVLDERLEEKIKLKEKEIADVREDAKLTERLDTGKEVHDIVKQLLGASKLYVDMAKRGGDHGEMYLSRSSEYTNMAIEEIRKFTRGLTTATIKNIGLCEAIENFTRDTMEINPVKISCSFRSFLENSVNEVFKLNIFGIVQEQMNNIFKNAKAAEVIIKLSQNKDSIMLVISDNGYDKGKKPEEIDLNNIRSFAASYNGMVDFISQPGQGGVLAVTFPAKGTLMKKFSVLELTNDKKNMLIEKIKNVIIELVHHSDDQINTNLSDYLSVKLNYDYKYLSRLFSGVEGITIQHFIVAQKIEWIKELIVNNELNLTEIAWKLHYSSVAHLSNQFKKVTGLTPSYFKKQYT